jgi:hypothetical protein
MDTERRSMQDRRSVKDRRRLVVFKHLFLKTKDRGDDRERRRALERRWGWVRLSRWSSVYLASLKLAKFLKPKDRKAPP